MLGSKSRGLTNPNEGDTMVMNSRIGHVVLKFLPIINHPGLRARASLFIVGDQESYYNALNTHNHLPHQ
jgi:hypothetical protein